MTPTPVLQVRWPRRLTAVAGLLALAGGLYTVLSVVLLAGAALGKDWATHDLGRLALILPIAVAVLVTGIRLGTRPTRVWWWAGIGGVSLIGVADLLDTWFAHHRFDPFTMALPGLALAALLSRPVRTTVALFEDAAQARRATTSRNSQSIEPPVDDSTQA